MGKTSGSVAAARPLNWYRPAEINAITQSAKPSRTNVSATIDSPLSPAAEAKGVVTDSPPPYRDGVNG